MRIKVGRVLATAATASCGTPSWQDGTAVLPLKSVSGCPAQDRCARVSGCADGCHGCRPCCRRIKERVSTPTSLPDIGATMPGRSPLPGQQSGARPDTRLSRAGVVTGPISTSSVFPLKDLGPRCQSDGRRGATGQQPSGRRRRRLGTDVAAGRPHPVRPSTEPALTVMGRRPPWHIIVATGGRDIGITSQGLHAHTKLLAVQRPRPTDATTG